ncbi:MAG: LysR family transcriptional regulator [Candidatus Sericytochromatia bacterium]|nr:LysR family transcriptional regulator [Candidatus Sericytochromatia bacterium]
MDRLEQMDIFCRVAERGSFSAVARDLYTSQPSISRAIQLLETRLGLRLFQRSTRRLSLTEAGQNYYSQCRKWLEGLESIEATLRNEHEQVHGRLALTAPVSMGDAFLNQILLRFQAAHPDLVLDLSLTDNSVNLVAEGMDLALRIGKLEDSSLEHHKLGLIERQIVGVPSWHQQLSFPCRPDDLKALPFVTFSRLEGGKALTFTGPQGKHTIEVHSRFLTTHAQALRQALLAGVGIGSAPIWLTHADLAEGTLVSFPVADYHLAHREIYALYPSRAFLPAKVGRCLDFLRHELLQIPGILPP